MRTLSSVLAIGLLVFLAAPLAADPAILEACINKGNGGVRLVAADALCHANESRVQWNVVGPAGPQGPPGLTGPAGPQGPAGEDGEDGIGSGGPPYVWVCTPANYMNAGSVNANLHVFNGGGATANVAVHFLNKDGVNLAGVLVPGAVPPNPGDPAPTYPGQTGATTVTLPSGATQITPWYTAQGVPAAGGDVLATIRVTSDQPIVVGHIIQFSGFHVTTCAALPK